MAWCVRLDFLVILSGIMKERLFFNAGVGWVSSDVRFGEGWKMFFWIKSKAVG